MIVANPFALWGRPASVATDATSPPAIGGLGAQATLGPIGDVVDRASEAPSDVLTGRVPRLFQPDELTGYVWPIDGARITNGYGLDRPGNFLLDGRSFHDGIDVASFCGDRIVAAHDGTVLTAGRRSEAFVGWLGDLSGYRARLDAEEGWGGQAIIVVIDDGNGYRSLYAHLRRALVQAGQQVRAGELIGYEGATGNASGCHLHYALFSPLETRALALDPKVAAKTRLPGAEIARVDPLRVMPPPEQASLTWGWGSR